MTTRSVILSSNEPPYRFSMTGNFSSSHERLIQSCLENFFVVTGAELSATLRGSQMSVQLGSAGNNFRLPYLISLNPLGLTEWTVTHELSHALDASHGWQLSLRMQDATASFFPWPALHRIRPQWKMFWYHAGSPPPPCGVDKNFNPREDFAEAVTAYVFPEDARERALKRGYPYEKWGYTHFHQTPRGQFIDSLIKEK